VLPDQQVKKQQPNWNEFYKNGVPKEIIVIDDDTPTPPPPPPPQQQPPQQPLVRTNSRQQYDAYNTTAGRKRKVDQGYDVEYPDSPTYSHHLANYGGTSSSASLHSADRTQSLQTTAPTSLDSYGSVGASNSYEDLRVGQKRKRIQPQKETRAQAKRKQQEASDAFADYVPPTKPLRKAGDVNVPVIKDVGHDMFLKDSH